MKFSNVLLQITKMDWKQPEHDEKRSDFKSSDIQNLNPKEKELKSTAINKNDKSHKNIKLYQLGYDRHIKLDKERAKNKDSFVAQKYNTLFNPSI